MEHVLSALRDTSLYHSACKYTGRRYLSEDSHFALIDTALITASLGRDLLASRSYGCQVAETFNNVNDRCLFMCRSVSTFNNKKAALSQGNRICFRFKVGRLHPLLALLVKILKQ